LLLPGLAVLAAIACGIARAEPQGAPPNILVILLDDAGWRDTGFAGNPYVETPNIDRLAMRGMRFSAAYATHPFCSPTRQSLVSGQWPARTAWMRRSEMRDPEAPQKAPPFSPTGAAGWTKRVPEFTSLAQALKPGGYATAHIGKSHVHFRRSMAEMGFDFTFGDSHEAGAVKSFFAPYEGLPGKVQAPPGEYLTDRLTEEAIGFIRSHKDRPFYVQLWHYAPHAPIQAPEPVVAKYRAKRQALGDMTLNPTYAAMIDVVDQGVGRIVGELEKLGLAENTAVLFASDNGGVASLGSVPVTSIAPLRGHKQMVYEGGVRVPMFAHWPGHTRPGAVSAQAVSLIDFYPTILEMAGCPLPGQPVDGISLVPLLEGEPMPALNDRPLYWHNVTAGLSDSGERFQPVAAARKGDWRLVKNFGRPTELYDLASDPGESADVAAANPERVAELERLLDGWLADTGVATPTPNPDYDPDYLVPQQVERLPSGTRLVKEWKPGDAGSGWKTARMVKASSRDGALRMQADGVYPEIKTGDVAGLPGGRYAVQVELNVPASGRIRFAWRGGSDKGDLDFFPRRDGRWHTLTALFQAREPMQSLSFAAPTHLKETGHYDPGTQPAHIDVRAIRLFEVEEREQ
jgi:arylsulfatase A-like enzyme